MTKPPTVWSAHPGSSPLIYELAAALPALGYDAQFLTGFYYDPKGFLATLVKALPGSLSAKLEREFRRRTHPAIDPKRTVTHPFWEFAFVAAMRLAPTRRGWATAIMDHRNARFDEATASLIRRDRPDLVIGYDTSAIRTLRSARAVGSVAVLNQVIGHLAVGRKTLAEEAERNPAFADSLNFHAPDWLVEQCTLEALAADHVFAPSPYVRDTLLEVGVPADRIALLPYGVRVERFKPPEKPREDGIFRVLYVGQLSQRKGLSYLLDAWAKLKLPNAELVLVGGIVGSGDGFRPYAGQFRHVRNLPHHEVADLYRTADIMAYPSLHEGSALAILEAMASGLPIVTTPNSGSLVQDGVDGFITQMRDVDALASRIEELYRNPEKRQKMGKAACANAQNYSWDHYRVRLKGFLDGMLASR